MLPSHRRKGAPLSVIDFLIGQPIATSDERAQQIGVSKGIPIFGLDALSSAAYGPEAALTLLIPLGVAGLAYIVPITASILALLIIVFFSYRQTIKAYPSGGGSYIVASDNLGMIPGLTAAAALQIDYVLTVSVSIAAGVAAITSLVPDWLPYTVPMAVGAVALIAGMQVDGGGADDASGIAIMTALADRMTVSSTPDGRTIRLEFDAG